MAEVRSAHSGPDLEGLKAFSDGTDRFPRSSDLRGIDPKNLVDHRQSRRWVADQVSRELLRDCFHECSIRDEELISISRGYLSLSERGYSVCARLWEPHDHRPELIDAWLTDSEREMVSLIRECMHQLEWGNR